MSMGTRVLLFVPNIIGYIRIVLIFVASLFFHQPEVFIYLYIAAALLDGLDGIAARKLNQVSLFGAWLDVVVDVTSRSLLWCNLYKWGFLVSCVEWLTFVCTHSQKEADWKHVHAQTPIMVKKIMEKNFKTALGSYAVLSLFGLPLWLYSHYSGLMTRLHIPHVIQYTGIGLLSGGRAVCFVAEVWYISQHIQLMLKELMLTDFVCDKINTVLDGSHLYSNSLH